MESLKEFIARERMKEMRAKMREYRRAQEADVQTAQRRCVHMQGCHPASDCVGMRPAIAWHVLDNRDLIGICTNCQRKFLPTDEDYNYWIHQETANVTSTAAFGIHPCTRNEAIKGSKYQFNPFDGYPENSEW